MIGNLFKKFFSDSDNPYKVPDKVPEGAIYEVFDCNRGIPVGEYIFFEHEAQQVADDLGRSGTGLVVVPIGGNCNDALEQSGY